MKRESFVFYRSFYEAIKDLPDTDRLEALDAIIGYAIDGDTPQLTLPIAKAIFALVKPQIDANNKKFMNGKKGGAPIGNQNARKQPKNNQKQPNVNVNENDNDNENVNDNDNVNERMIDKIIQLRRG